MTKFLDPKAMEETMLIRFTHTTNSIGDDNVTKVQTHHIATLH